MSIVVDSGTRVVIQGITGRTGQLFAERMQACGTRVVGGVTPKKGGSVVQGLPVFDSVQQAVDETGADAALSCVGPRHALDALIEAVDAGVATVVTYIENVPVHDAIVMRAYARSKGTRLLGPNSAGVVTPRQCNLSDVNEDNLKPGPVGIVSKSGTLTYEVIASLGELDLGVSTVVCLGGDRVLGTAYTDILPLFDRDPETRAIVLIGEPGGGLEQEAARIASTLLTPVVAFITGNAAPRLARMGHAGAVVGDDARSWPESKVRAFADAGCSVVTLINAVAPCVVTALGAA